MEAVDRVLRGRRSTDGSNRRKFESTMWRCRFDRWIARVRQQCCIYSEDLPAIWASLSPSPSPSPCPCPSPFLSYERHQQPPPTRTSIENSSMVARNKDTHSTGKLILVYGTTSRHSGKLQEDIRYSTCKYSRQNAREIKGFGWIKKRGLAGFTERRSSNKRS